jgi:hypothetical protein
MLRESRLLKVSGQACSAQHVQHKLPLLWSVHSTLCHVSLSTATCQTDILNSNLHT